MTLIAAAALAASTPSNGDKQEAVVDGVPATPDAGKIVVQAPPMTASAEENLARQEEVERILAGGEKPVEKEKKHAKKAKSKKELTGRDAKITSATMSYDRKEGILFFDRNVFVDDEQYQMHADRVYVFLNGTNDVKRLVALGNVALTNEFRSATCDKAVYMKAASKVILYAPEGGVATLKDESQKGGTISGSRITFWLDSEQVEVQNSDITVPGGAFKANDAKKLLGK